MTLQNGKYFLKSSAYKPAKHVNISQALNKLGQADQATNILQKIKNEYASIAVEELLPLLADNYNLNKTGQVAKFLGKLIHQSTSHKQQILQIINTPDTEANPENASNDSDDDNSVDQNATEGNSSVTENTDDNAQTTSNQQNSSEDSNDDNGDENADSDDHQTLLQQLRKETREGNKGLTQEN